MPQSAQADWTLGVDMTVGAAALGGPYLTQHHAAMGRRGESAPTISDAVGA